MIFPLILIAAAVFVSGGVFWLWVQAPQLAGLVTMVFEWCQSVTAFCTSVTPVLMASLMWAGALALGTGLVYAGIRQGRGFFKGYRAIGKLPLKRCGSIALIKDDSLKTAFTHGLLRPRIYISTGLIRALARDELRSVLLHEIHHRRNRDPLRFFLAAFLKDIFYYMPIGGYLAGRLHADSEKTADDSVIKRTQDPLSLAGALVKVALSGPEPGPVRLVSFRGASVEDRIKRLLVGEREDAVSMPGLRAVISSAVMSAVVVLSLLIPMAASGSYEPVFCTKSHCATMAHGKGTMAHGAHNGVHRMDCKTHCELKRAGRMTM